jgi:tetratricopeptide (TPR) repeat protein
MAVPINPYVAGAPLRGEKGFFGRKDILRWVERELCNPASNALVLFGQRRIGKTTLLLQLERTLPADAFLPVYFDLQDQASHPLGVVLADLADTAAWRANLEPLDPEAFDDQGRFFHRQFLPRLYQALGENRRIVFLLDEFDVLDWTAEAELLETAAAKTLLPFLRRMMTQDPQSAFVFVVGRRAEDLSQDFLATFKASLVRKVGTLDRKSAERLVRQAEYNNTLALSDQAVEHILNLTSSHPYFTQLLCQRIWEQAYMRNPPAPPWIQIEDVKNAVSDALEAGSQALAWLWDGLPPAERVVASALAGAGPGPITQDELEHLLHESGVRVVIRELKEAPQLLQKWDLIEPIHGGYRFCVELLRRWIADHKPLESVQEELDRIEPAAENLYQAASELYQGGQLDQAVELLRQAIRLNPNHVRANQLLADILLAREQLDEAQQLLERLYEHQPAAARPQLARTLLAQAQIAAGDDDRLALYEQAMKLAPDHADVTLKVAQVKREIQRRLTALYQRAQRALESDDEQKAQTLLGDTVTLYKNASGLYQNELDQIAKLLLPMIDANYVESNLLLADILFAQEQLDEAQQLLEQSYRHQPAAARPRLVQVLLAKAWDAESDDEQLVLYEQVLELNTSQIEALAGQQRIWKNRGDAALKAKELKTASEAYEKAGLRDKAAEIRQEIQRRLAHQQARKALQSGDRQTAQTLLTEVLAHLAPISPKNSSRLTHLFHWDNISVNEIACSCDGALLAVASFSGIYLYDTRILDKVWFIKTRAPVHSVAFSPDGMILASGLDSGTVRLWQTSDGSPLHALKGHRSSVYSVTFSPDGKTLATGSWDQTVQLWQVNSGQPLDTLKGHQSSVYSMAYLPKETEAILASGSRDKTVHLWQVNTCHILKTIKHQSSVYSVLFSPDGTILASGAGDGTIELRKTDGAIIPLHTPSKVNSLAFSPDGTILASGSRDKKVRLWQVDDGSLLRTLEKHARSVESVAFAPNGILLASGSQDGIVLWGIAPD